MIDDIDSRTCIYYLARIESAGNSGQARSAISANPFAVGRSPSCNLQIDETHVSHKHAQFHFHGDELRVRDLGSTNGTFVNGDEVISDRALSSGDIVHFAEHAFRVEVESRPEKREETAELPNVGPHLGKGSIKRAKELVERLQRRDVHVVYQPVLNRESGKIYGYEALGRAVVGGTLTVGRSLFDMGMSLGLCAQLSRTFREIAFAESAMLPRIGEKPPVLFVNLHKDELGLWQKTLESLRDLRQRSSLQPVVIELPETALTESLALDDLRRDLGGLEVGLALDDFGTQQLRLDDLAALAPDYVKFDRTLVHEAAVSERMLVLVQGIVEAINRIGSRTVAENVQNEQEAEACNRAGFDFVQGFYYGLPVSVDALQSSSSNALPSDEPIRTDH